MSTVPDHTFGSRLAGLLRARRDSAAGPEDGVIAIIVALLAIVFLGLAALAVDVARVYVEGERLQKAADAAAMAGVTSLPNNMTAARTRALDALKQNGYVNGGNASVTTEQLGVNSTRLKVIVSTEVDNGFAAALGTDSSSIQRVATADFLDGDSSPMASPCNTFGNEPDGTNYPGAGPKSVLSTVAGCVRDTEFWTSIQGPNTLKDRGDQFMTRRCDTSSSGRDGCSGSTNAEFDPQGYFYAVDVRDPATTGAVTVQLYDPAYINAETSCSALPSSDYWFFGWHDNIKNNMNGYTTTDGRARYDDENNAFCAGDYDFSSDRVDTTFTLRAPTPSRDPKRAPIVPGCVAQFKGRTSAPSKSDLEKTNELTRVFHQWVPLCTIPNPAQGQYYLQVRTNVALPSMSSSQYIAGSAVPGTVAANTAATTQTGDNTSVGGNATNAFGVRAVTANTNGYAAVSVAGHQRMSMSVNAENQDSTFKMIKVLPSGRGQTIKFSIFDAADEAWDGSYVQVLPPEDAGGAIDPAMDKCIGGPNDPVNQQRADCRFEISEDDNAGRLQTIYIPVPSDYTCNVNDPGGCWYRIRVYLNNDGSSPQDTTTWQGSVTGDPVRLVP